MMMNRLVQRLVLVGRALEFVCILCILGLLKSRLLQRSFNSFFAVLVLGVDAVDMMHDWSLLMKWHGTRRRIHH